MRCRLCGAYKVEVANNPDNFMSKVDVWICGTYKYLTTDRVVQSSYCRNYKIYWWKA